MELLVFWLGSSVASFGMLTSVVFRIIKDIADAGYKFNIKNASKLGEQVNSLNESNFSMLSMLIPILNFAQVFKISIQYNNVRNMLIDQLNIANVLEEMTDLEKEEYQKNPTGLNALLVAFKMEQRLEMGTTIEIKDGIKNSKIVYEKGKSPDDITILKIDGPLSRLSVEEQKEKVINAIKSIEQIKVAENEDNEKFTKELDGEMNNNYNIGLISDIEEKETEKFADFSTNQLSISEQKRNLENLKNELLKPETEKQSQSDKGSSLQKRKK